MMYALLTIHWPKKKKKISFNIKFYQNIAMFLDKVLYFMFL